MDQSSDLSVAIVFVDLCLISHCLMAEGLEGGQRTFRILSSLTLLFQGPQ